MECGNAHARIIEEETERSKKRKTNVSTNGIQERTAPLELLRTEEKLCLLRQKDFMQALPPRADKVLFKGVSRKSNDSRRKRESHVERRHHARKSSYTIFQRDAYMESICFLSRRFHLPGMRKTRRTTSGPPYQAFFHSSRVTIRFIERNYPLRTLPPKNFLASRDK